MCAQSNPAESYQGNQQYCAENGQSPPVPYFHPGQDKKQELPIKQSRSNRVATGKTVTRPIHKRAVNERAMPMNKHLHQLIKQHAAWNSHNQSDERRPRSFPDEKQYHEKQNNTDPLARTKIGERPQDGHKCAGQVRVEPCREPVIGFRKGIDYGEDHGIGWRCKTKVQ